MKKALQYNNCFVCGKDSKTGLKVDFEITESGARAVYTPTSEFEGFRGIVHGGILCSLLDEIMWKAVNGNTGALTVTARMEVKFKRPAKVGEMLIIEGSITDHKKRFFETKGIVSDSEGTILAEATGLFMNVDEDTKARMSEFLTC